MQISDHQTGGTVTANTRYAKEGTEIVLTVVPEDGYALKSLRVNGKAVEVDEDLTYTFTLERNTRVVARVYQDRAGDNGNGGGSDRDSDDSYGIGSSKAGGAAPSYAVSGAWSRDGRQVELLCGKRGADGFQMGMHPLERLLRVVLL